ncbi:MULTISPECIES: hypothetical protein [unclassified Haladaptatus]|uniref:hypothetical protein n=1 Tax=unclassified Haladaptatus TaxID=2622732 RepID=UPI0023E8E71E|nr:MULTISPECIES: hypothetical protein [unclassified Haladaptatus]
MHQTPKPRILIVGRDFDITTSLVRNLRRAGYDVDGIHGDGDIDAIWKPGRFDAIVLGSGLDEPHREAWLTTLESLAPTTPIYTKGHDGMTGGMATYLASVVVELRSPERVT